MRCGRAHVLAMELSEDYTARAQILGIKGLFGLLGFFGAALTSVILGMTLGANLVQQVWLLGNISVVLVAGAWLLLMCGVKERINSDVSTAVSFVPSIRDLLHNGPYVNYLLIKLCLTLAAHLPRSVMLYFIKYYLRYENTIVIFNLSALQFIVVSAFLMQPTVKLMRRFGKKELLVMACMSMAVSMAVAGVIPAHVMRENNLIFALNFFIAFGNVASTLIPEAILADIIDYDELHSGTRRAGVYVDLETNIMQVLDIFANMPPLLLLAANNYQNNGGCSCGCGTMCPLPYQRWSCPGDIGYACARSLSAANRPFFGDPHREAPCTDQPAGVHLVIATFTFYVPVVFYILVLVPAWFAPIDAAKQAEIVEQTELRHRGELAHDPLSGVELPPYPTDEEREEMNALLQFDKDELEFFERHGFAMVCAFVAGRLVMWVAGLTYGVYYIRRSMGTPQFASVMSLGSIAVTTLTSLVVWELLRISSLIAHKDELEEYRAMVMLMSDFAAADNSLATAVGLQSSPHHRGHLASVLSMASSAEDEENEIENLLNRQDKNLLSNAKEEDVFRALISTVVWRLVVIASLSSGLTVFIVLFAALWKGSHNIDVAAAWSGATIAVVCLVALAPRQIDREWHRMSRFLDSRPIILKLAKKRRHEREKQEIEGYTEAMNDIQEQKGKQECTFKFLRRDDVIEFHHSQNNSGLPVFKNWEALGWTFEDKTFSRGQTFRGIIEEDCLIVSHRWLEKQDPDSKGEQLTAIVKHLQQEKNASIQFIWYDYTCMPQGSRDAIQEVCLPDSSSLGSMPHTRYARSLLQVRFEHMLSEVNLLYLGALVLLVVDKSYGSRFVRCTTIHP